MEYTGREEMQESRTARGGIWDRKMTAAWDGGRGQRDGSRGTGHGDVWSFLPQSKVRSRVGQEQWPVPGQLGLQRQARCEARGFGADRRAAAFLSLSGTLAADDVEGTSSGGQQQHQAEQEIAAPPAATLP